MSICGSCGSQSHSGEGFCRTCGASLGDDARGRTDDAGTPTETTATASHPPAQSKSVSADSSEGSPAESTHGRRGGLWLWVLVAGAALAVVGVGAFLLGRSSDVGTSAPQPIAAVPAGGGVPRTGATGKDAGGSDTAAVPASDATQIPQGDSYWKGTMPDGHTSGWMALRRAGNSLTMGFAAPTGGMTYCFQGAIAGGQTTGQSYELANYYTISPHPETYVVGGSQSNLQFHLAGEASSSDYTSAKSDASTVDFAHLLQACAGVPSAPPSANLSATGSWAGEMYGETNTYTLALDITEAADGSLNTKARQVELDKGRGAPTGQVGTEVLAGTRSGSDLTLQGQHFEPGAPSSWLLDTMHLTMSGDGSQLSGTYVCAQCGTSPMQARRQ